MNIYLPLDKYAAQFQAQGFDCCTAYEMAYKKCEEVLK